MREVIVMSTEEFIEGEKKIRIKHQILLLTDLLYYNYVNNSNFDEDKVLNSLQDALVFSKEEKKQLLEKAKENISKMYKINIDSIK